VVARLLIERLVAGGTGLAQLHGMKVFVPFSAPGERVKARLVLKKRDYAVAAIEEVIEPSPDRVTPPCPYFGDCGGCQLQHLKYEAQLVAKKLIIADALQRIGRIFVPVRNITPADPVFRYRNKTQYPVGRTRGHKPVAASQVQPAQIVDRRSQIVDSPAVGFYRHETHDLVDIPSCLLHPETFDRMRQVFLDSLVATGEQPYDEKTDKGNVRHLLLKTNGAEHLAVVVTRTESLAPRVVQSLAGEPGVAGVIQNLNPDRTNRILGDRFVVHSGRDWLDLKVLDRTFRVSPGAFFQVNLPQAEEICRKVLKFLAPTGDEELLDLYSGVGMLSLAAARFVKAVTGIEYDETSVRDARLNAERNNEPNARFIAADVDASVSQVARADLVVLDPPRKGCSPTTLKALTMLKPRRMVYVSCSPATLARDLNVLETLGYRATDVEPVDMFCQTSHVEVVCRLEPGPA